MYITTTKKLARGRIYYFKIEIGHGNRKEEYTIFYIHIPVLHAYCIPPRRKG